MPDLNLSELQKGQKARIKGLSEALYANKLMEMGCIPGVEIALLMKAPSGDPIAFRVMDYTLCMRRSEAASIEVEMIE